MVDCSTIEEGMYAAELGFDLVGTTMSGSTEYTQGRKLPDLVMIKELEENRDSKS